jgi:hypothetical protein
MPIVNTEAMNLHLKEIRARVATGAHALLVCDGADWRQPGDLRKIADSGVGNSDS